MLSDYVCLNSRTFEIGKEKDIIPVDEQLANTLSILNKKGYYTEIFNRARISKTFLVGAIIHDLKEQGLLAVTNQTKDIIKNIIKQSDYESTLIIFKEKYNFDKLPDGFKLIDRDLFYNIEVLKNNDDIELKTLVELDKEHRESIKNLEKWAIDLPDISNQTNS